MQHQRKRINPTQEVVDMGDLAGKYLVTQAQVGRPGVVCTSLKSRHQFVISQASVGDAHLVQMMAEPVYR